VTTGSITNTGTGDSTETPPDDDVLVTPVVGSPALAIVKSAPAAATIGVAFDYTLTVTNSGTAATTATATISDTIPAGLTINTATGCVIAAQTVTCTIPAGLSNVAPGNTAVFTINVTPTVAATNPILNSANVTGGGDPNCVATTDCADDESTPLNSPVLNITKSATPNPFVVGQPASYTITVQNTGTAATTANVVVTDTLPTGIGFVGSAGMDWTCVGSPTLTCTYTGTLAAGASTVLTIDVSVGAGATNADNTASVTGGGDPQCVGAPLPDRCDDTVLVPVVSPDLILTKTHSGSFVRGESGGVYSLLVTNIGDAASSGTVTVVDNLPAGLTATAISGAGWTCTLATLTCTRGDVLAVGASFPAIVINVTVDSNAPESVVNVAVVSGGNDDDPSNNSDDDPVTITSVTAPQDAPVPVPMDARWALMLLAMSMLLVAAHKMRQA
jgi:uncharacterized repeat protein (TIGR01451 family)